MKTIIVATDFSPAALNATNYACDLALAIKAELLLLHVYQLPLAVADTPIIFLSVEELQESADTKLRDLKADLAHVTSGALEIRTESRLGTLADELEACCNEVQPFAVIMGTRGESAVERALFGSNALKIVNHLSWPVICVPVGKEYSPGIRKIGFACDIDQIKNNTPLPVVKTFTQQFNAELHILSLGHDEKIEAGTETMLLKTALQDLQPQYHAITQKNIEAGVSEFAENNNLDLVITIPKKHKLIEGLFRKNTSNQLVFHSHVPVMCIHE
jgi:nucleotide-binding universal stress UspA family protein